MKFQFLLFTLILLSSVTFALFESHGGGFDGGSSRDIISFINMLSCIIPILIIILVILIVLYLFVKNKKKSREEL